MALQIFIKKNQILDLLSEWVNEIRLSPFKNGKTVKVLSDSIYQEFQNWLVKKNKQNYKFNKRFIGRSLSLFHSIVGSRGDSNQHLFTVNRDCTLLKPSVVKIDLTTDSSVQVNVNKCGCGGDCVPTPCPCHPPVQGATGPGLPSGFMGVQ